MFRKIDPALVKVSYGQRVRQHPKKRAFILDVCVGYLYFLAPVLFEWCFGLFCDIFMLFIFDFLFSAGFLTTFTSGFPTTPMHGPLCCVTCAKAAPPCVTTMFIGMWTRVLGKPVTKKWKRTSDRMFDTPRAVLKWPLTRDSVFNWTARRPAVMGTRSTGDLDLSSITVCGITRISSYFGFAVTVQMALVTIVFIRFSIFSFRVVV